MQVSSNSKVQQAFSGSLSARNVAAVSERLDDRQTEPAKRQFGDFNGRKGQGLGVFRQELRSSVRTLIKARFVSSQNAYSRPPTSANDVANEALGAAKRLLNESPGDAAKSLISFRARIRESANFARETVRSPAERQEVDAAAAKIDKGLAKLESQAKANETSTASVLDINTKTKQRSFIKIRTQEGDIVKLSLRRVDKLSATDVAESNGNSSKTSTEVSLSSRSRMMLKVDGDLNDAEMEAIKGVFAQAEAIANNFFGGDMQAAFGAAQGFEFDSEQLSRVNMRFRLRQVSSASYVERTRVTQPAVKDTAPATDRVQAPVSRPTTNVDDTPKLDPIAANPVTVLTPPRSASVEPESTVKQAITDDVVASPKAAPPAESTGLASLWNALSAFLQSVNEGFDSDASSASVKIHYSQAFKLELLKSVVNTVTDEGLTDSVADKIDAYLSVDQEAA